MDDVELGGVVMFMVQARSVAAATFNELVDGHSTAIARSAVPSGLKLFKTRKHRQLGLGVVVPVYLEVRGLHCQHLRR